jgi:hypothetical protein
MNKLYLFLFLAAVHFHSVAQEISRPVWSHELEGEAWNNWDSINNHWIRNVYFPCLKANNLKMSCANCVYIYIDAEFTIDSCGKLTDIKIIKENICSRKANDKLRNCFFNYFREMTFPPALRHKRIISKFGTGLKC